MLQNIFDCVGRWEVFWLVNHRVSNWIVFCEKSDSFLKCSDVFVAMSILMSKAWRYDKLLAEKCIEDASEYIWLRCGGEKCFDW